jgi:mannan endo-1,4-beta-mannosidase
MRRRLLGAVVALAACAVAVCVSGCRPPGFGATAGAAAGPVALTGPPSRPMSYLGVYEPSSPDSFTGVAKFAAVVRARPNLALYYAGWGEPFPTRFAEAAYQHGAEPYVDVDPSRISLASIAGGLSDDYIRLLAGQIRRYRHPVVISFGHEMNTTWFPWGYRHVPADTWVAAWRHLVTIFRQSGASNVTWLWTVNREASGEGPIKDWWPGRSYVDWVGIDGYYLHPADTFASVFGATIAAIRALTAQPILISETGVGELAGQAAKIPNLFAGVRRRHLLGLVWFDKRQHQGIDHQDWRIEGHRAAVLAFRHADRAFRDLARPDHWPPA